MLNNQNTWALTEYLREKDVFQFIKLMQAYTDDNGDYHTNYITTPRTHFTLIWPEIQHQARKYRYIVSKRLDMPAPARTSSWWASAPVIIPGDTPTLWVTLTLTKWKFIDEHIYVMHNDGTMVFTF